MNWENRLRGIAEKHGFDPEATEFMAHAIQNGGGRHAQWKHPGLGGFGQWIPGMTTLSPREPALEKRLDAMCRDLMALLYETNQAAMVWWPRTLGLQPDATGAQDRVRYAYFGSSRRLAVDRGDGRVTVYDTGDHHVCGVSPVQGTDGRLMFQSQLGEDKLDALAVVEPPGD